MALSEEDSHRLILQAIASGSPVTQRSLARQLGVAVGLTNLLIRRLVAKGYVKLSRASTRHVRYLMTPAGFEALARATRMSLENTVHLYTQTREQICGSLKQLSERCPAHSFEGKRIVFYGAGDVAEIAYVSLQNTDLALVGVVDDVRTGRFFNMQISSPDDLTCDTLDGAPYSHVVVTSLRHADVICRRLADRHVPPDRVFCL